LVMQGILRVSRMRGAGRIRRLSADDHASMKEEGKAGYARGGDHDVIVVRGGLAGLTAARQFGRAAGRVLDLEARTDWAAGPSPVGWLRATSS
jgi:hypothetical protein